MEAARQDVEQEPTDELVGGERHDLLPVGARAAIVLVAEGDVALVETDDASVRDGDPVRVARQSYVRPASKPWPAGGNG